MNINNPSHRHHKIWREHVESVLSEPENPKVVQAKYADAATWEDLEITGHSGTVVAHWEGGDFRIKPATVTRTLTYPKPLSEVPEKHAEFWYLSSSSDNGTVRASWGGYWWQDLLFKRSMCFATEADALAAAKEIFGGGV